MNTKPWIRTVALILLAALILGALPFGLASDLASGRESSTEEEIVDAVESTEGPSSEPSEKEPEKPAEKPEPANQEAEDSTAEKEEPEASTEPETGSDPEDSSEEEKPKEDDVPRSMDGETLTRDESLLTTSSPTDGILRKATAGLRATAASGSMGKTTCVNFSEYVSPVWYCNRYYTDGSHANGHYFYADTISYHTISGTDAYCIEPNTSSLAGQTYTSYAANSASSTSFWKRELDDRQRTYIQQILAFGYPNVNYGYSRQVQYAATQVLIWEIAAKIRYDSSSVRYASSYGLFSAVYATLGANFQACYDAILNNVSISNGKVPSFSGGSSPSTVTLTYNSSTNKYEGSVTDSNAVLSYFTFAYSGVTFTKSGNTLKISVPAANAASVKGKTITGTSTQRDMSTSNPTVWENSYYQTVTTTGGADYKKAYIKLTWTEPATPTPTPSPTPTPTPTPTPSTGTLKIVKSVSDSSISASGWQFSINITQGIGTITRTTNSSGVITVTSIPDGAVCTVTETVVNGYQTVSSQSATITGGQTSTLYFTNKPLKGNATITKTLSYGSSYSGFRFRLYGTSTIGKAVDLTATTDSSGKAYFTGVYVGTYTLEELDPGDAYVKPASRTVQISANQSTGAATTTRISMRNTYKHWYAVVTKRDFDTNATGAMMAGAEYTLYENGTAVATYTVGSDGTFTTDQFPCTANNTTYKLKETRAPDGYLLDNSTYTLSTSYTRFTSGVNKITKNVYDEQEEQSIAGKIRIEKYAVNTVSGTRQAENGATYEVYLKSAGSYANAAADQRDIITIGSDGKGTSKDLPEGTYCIRQRTGWNGYILDSVVHAVSITTNGQIVTKDTSNRALSFENNIFTGGLTVLKKDADSGAVLSGAEFTLTGSDGSSKTATTGADGKALFSDLVYGVTYTWKETKAPKGYLLNTSNQGTWTVTENQASATVTVQDQRRPGSISVTKQDMDGNALSGATFLLEYLDGTVWRPVTTRTGNTITKGGTTSAVSGGCLTTDASGIVTFSGLLADETVQYRLTEVSAPNRQTLLSEPAYEGTLPVSMNRNQTSAEPDEVIGNTAYFYSLPVTVRDGKIYTLPQTGRSGYPLIPLAAVLVLLGTGLTAFTIYQQKRQIKLRRKTT